VITFDPATRRIVLDSTSVTAAELWSRWSDWAATSDNAKYLPAFRQAGGDDLGGGLSIPAYMFLLNDWRVRPMEANHTLVITGNLFVDGGGVPVVGTLGAFNVSAQFTVPVQAQAVSTGGGSGGLTTEQANQLAALAKIHGLVMGSPLTVTTTARAAGGVVQTIAEASGTVTVERTA
jgi:hypothetical protein